MSHSTARAAAFVSGTTVSVAALVEHGLARIVEEWFIGLAGLILTIGRIEAGLIAGVGKFFGALVDASLGDSALVLAGAWEGTAAEWLGPLAPMFVLAQMLAVFAAAAWGVRHL